MNQIQLAELAGINVGTIRKYELGLRNPKPDQLEKIASALGLNVSVFLDFKIDSEKNISRIQITIHEGKNKQVRKMCEKIGYPVRALHRTKIGNIDVKDLKIGVCSEVKELVKGLPVEKTYFDLIERLKSQGNEIVEVSIKDLSLVMACYYIIAPAEATSNLGRFDGVKYSRREKGCQDIDEIYIKSRTAGFGKEVKRRIMLGNFVLSSGYFDAYYNKAKKVQQRLKKQTLDALASCDVLLLPTTCGEAFKIGEKIEDPISMYKEDIFTTLANITGLPALTLPCGKGENGMPLGMQFVGKEFEESKLYNLADYIERRRSEWNMI